MLPSQAEGPRLLELAMCHADGRSGGIAADHHTHHPGAVAVIIIGRGMLGGIIVFTALKYIHSFFS